MNQRFDKNSGKNSLLNGSKGKERRANGGREWLEALRRHRYLLLGGIILAAFIAILFPGEKSYQFSSLREGRVYIGPEIIASFTFPVNKSHEEYQADLRKARAEVAPVFDRVDSVAEAQLEHLELFVQRAGMVLRSGVMIADEVSRVFQEGGIILSEEDIVNLMSGSAGGEGGSQENRRGYQLRAIAAAVEKLLRESYTAGILSVERSAFSPLPTRFSIRYRGLEVFENSEFILGLHELRQQVPEKLRISQQLDDAQSKIGYKMALAFLSPNLIYDQAETQTRMEEAVALVPLAKDQVLAGERIIDGHERITRGHIEKLNSYAAAKTERGEGKGLISRLLHGLGQWGNSLFILSILLFFLWQGRGEIANAPKQLLLIALIVLLPAGLTFLVTQLNLSPLLIPVAAGAMIITIFFDVYVGLLYAISVSLLVGAMRGNEFGIAYISIFVSAMAILSVSRVRTRNWVLRSMGVVMAAYLLSITVHDLLNYQSFQEILRDWGLGFINGFISPIIAYALVLLLERTFHLTTDMTLLELSDLNHPLLRQLALQAPGTYHHSLSVGNLAETAAEAIGANALLARVGAYYHDIGKLEKPEYFVENQMRGRNPQEKLTPTMSSLILQNHVRRGAEMAAQYHLPPAVSAFIEEHHGTSLMHYFYQKAVEQKGEGAVPQDEFRYPGPRPSIRESAIVMLADAVEATSRTLRDPSYSRIKNIVDQIIDERFKSGELDNSPLTLQDLARISEAFQKTLNARFHRRIPYPNQNTDDEGE
ncbi:MAG TPA: HDIG domain-containing protein [bacterium]|nr:HDIG domain-containing protein [bacterium]HPG82648.1 HDIG domain-containing protein [bacterium]HPM58586.1 HDIG domain-containing protein [bacterium]